MKVKNINGISDSTCNCASWLDHWRKFCGQPLPLFCPEATCSSRPEVAAHVQKDNATDSNWYIVPLCKKHNAETGKSLTISDSVALVSANVSQTCGGK